MNECRGSEDFKIMESPTRFWLPKESRFEKDTSEHMLHSAYTPVIITTDLSQHGTSLKCCIFNVPSIGKCRLKAKKSQIQNDNKLVVCCQNF